MDQGSKPDYSFLSGAKTSKPGPSKKQRILFVIGGGSALLIIGILLFSLIFGGKSDPSAVSLKLAQMHTELIRVSEIGKDSARGQTAKNLAATTHATLTSDQAAIVALAEKDQKVSSKLLSAGQDPETDQTLTEAEQRSQFDEVFIPLLIEEIDEYGTELKTAYENSNSKSSRETYQALYNNLILITKAAQLSE